MFIVYILYSKSRDKYYVGHSGEDLRERVRKHNTNHKGFTGGQGDWEVVYTERFKTRSEACAREREIKGRKSRGRIEKPIIKHRLVGSEHPAL